MTRILVTGATGNVGRTVTSLLADNPAVRVRALVRDAVASASSLPPTAELAVGDFTDPDSLDAALDGVDAVYLACGNVVAQVDHECTVIDRAAAAGVRRLVKLSARGAEIGSPVAFWHWHALIEAHLTASGIPSVVLRPSFLMTNLLAVADAVRDHGLVIAPAAHARISMVDPRDVAAVAAAVLVEAGTRGAVRAAPTSSPARRPSPTTSWPRRWPTRSAGTSRTSTSPRTRPAGRCWARACRRSSSTSWVRCSRPCAGVTSRRRPTSWRR